MTVWILEAKVTLVQGVRMSHVLAWFDTKFSVF